MQTGPKIKLAVDLHKIDKYFPLDHNLNGGFDYNMIIDRQEYDEVVAILGEYGITEDQTIREVCFMILWIEKETRIGDETNDKQGKFEQMWAELDRLKDYLLKNRITSISFMGEYERNKPGEEITIQDNVNIDRICDGIRSIFRDEFNNNKQKRISRGRTAWQRRKLIQIHNNFLNFFTSVPVLDELSLEDQNHLIGKLAELAGLRG